jgi:hypothetical protein
MLQSSFGTPAFIVDFPQDAEKQQQLDALWSRRVDGFTQQAILGDPWNSGNQANQTSYYNPLGMDIPSSAAVAAAVTWTAFPNRLIQYLGAGQTPANPYDLTIDDLLVIGDSGEGLQPIPSTHCPAAMWNNGTGPYGPYGPRGWLDEYCEWSVTKDADGNLVRVDFVCENPEYWYSLWQIDPQQVAALYEQTLNYNAPAERQITVTVEDLQLVGKDGKPVIDPFTGQPAYDPLNKWNSGTVSARTGSPSDSGGAMHLTSTPNTLQTELGLAGGASVLRATGNSTPQALICCGQYGQSYRNSDPHIGQQVNIAVSTPAIVSLADPVGLYIQPPDFTAFSTSGGLDVSECWQVVRGVTTLTDPVTNEPFPGAFNLHVAFQIPASWPSGMTLNDIKVTTLGQPPTAITCAGQIASTFQVGLFPRGIPAPMPPAQPCVATPSTAVAPPAQPVLIQPLQLFFADLWDAYYATSVPNPVDQQMSLASNTVIVPPRVRPGQTGLSMALTCSGVTDGRSPAIAFSGDGITVSNVSPPSTVTYAVPGNTYPGPCQLVTFDLDIASTAEDGLRSIEVTNFAQPPGPPAPAFLDVVASDPPAA